MPDNQQAEVRLKLVLDEGGLVRVMDQVSGATLKAAKSTDEYAKTLERTKQKILENKRIHQDLIREGVLEGPAAPPSFSQTVTRAEQSIRQQRQVREELVRRGVIEGPRQPLSVADEARNIAGGMARRAQVEQELVRMGVKQAPGANAEPGAFKAAGMEQYSGLLRGGGVLGGVAAGIYALKKTGDYMKEVGRIERDAFMPHSFQEEQKTRALPVVGGLYGYAMDITRARQGYDYRVGQSLREQQESTIKNEAQAEAQRVRLGLRFDRESAQGRAHLFGGLSLARAGSFDRGTVAGERAFEEDQKRLPVLNRLRVAQTESAAATERVTSLENEQARLARQGMSLDKEYQRARLERVEETKRDKGGTVQDHYSAQEAARKEQDAAERLEANRRLQRDVAERLPGERQGQSTAAAALRQVESERARAEGEIWSARAQQAAGQARNLTAMGPEGRLRGQLSLDLARQMGFDNAPAELQAAAAAYAPQTVGKEQERAGEQFRREARSRAPEEFEHDTDYARARSREFQNEGIRIDEGNLRQTAAELGKSFGDSVERVIRTIMQEVETRISALERNALTTHVSNSS